MKYKCDNCETTHNLDETKVKNKQRYVPPKGCFEGDYFEDDYFWFECGCGRAIKVEEDDLSKPHKIEKEYSAHRGVCNKA